MAKAKTNVRDFKPAEQFYKTGPLAKLLEEQNALLDTLIIAVNELKAVHDAHCADATSHSVADETNVTTFDDVVNDTDTGNLGE